MVEDQDNSVLAAIATKVAWIFAPLGFGNWRATVASVSGLIAKENVVGTFGVLYHFGGELSENGDEIWAAVAQDYTALSAYAFMIFNLLCAPCFAFIDEVNKREIPYETSATVLSLTADRVVTASTRSGLRQYQAKAVVLAMGCKERSRGALGIPGERPAGVFTAGTAQAYMNLYNRMPGKEVIILGSGDIGMIMARRMTLEGAHVQAVFELMPYPSGLPRNIVQCLDDYNIPLYLSHTVTEIHGRNRLTGVTISEVDANRRPIPGTEKEYKCDTLILSVGLIPENKLLEDAGIAIDPHTNGAFVDENLQTNVPGVFSAGNVLHVHDLVDFVSMESEALARHAAAYVEGKGIDPCTLDVKCETRKEDMRMIA